MFINEDIDKFICAIQEQTKRYTQYNFLKEMFNFSNERYLHSSFIAMLLSQENKTYLKEFLEALKKVKNKYGTPITFPENLDKVMINPNRLNHGEHENIDILISWRKEKTAIIIENKTFSGDRNGQDPQLISYHKKLDKEGYKNIYLVYLNFRGQEPEQIDKFKKYNLTIISYDTFIKEWIESCLEKCPDNNPLKVHLNEYYMFLLENLDSAKNADELRKKIKNHLTNSSNQDEAIQTILATYKRFIPDTTQEPLPTQNQENQLFVKVMRDMKWHILHEIMTGILTGLKDHYKGKLTSINWNRTLRKQIDTIAKHDNSTTKILIEFEYNQQHLYLCNDNNGFTLGKCRAKEEQAQYKQLNNIVLRDFLKSPESFKIILNQEQFIKVTTGQIMQYLETM